MKCKFADESDNFTEYFVKFYIIPHRLKINLYRVKCKMYSKALSQVLHTTQVWDKYKFKIKYLVMKDVADAFFKLLILL